MTDSRMNPPPPLLPPPCEEAVRLVIYHAISRRAIYRSAWMSSRIEVRALRAEICAFLDCIGIWVLIASCTQWRIERVEGAQEGIESAEVVQGGGGLESAEVVQGGAGIESDSRSD